MNSSVIRRLCPVDTINIVTRNRGKDVEVNGLPMGFVPQNCTVLAHGCEQHGNSARTHYLLNADSHVVYLTVCQPEYGDAQFALIRCMAQADTEEATEISQYALDSMKMLCKLS